MIRMVQSLTLNYSLSRSSTGNITYKILHNCIKFNDSSKVSYSFTFYLQITAPTSNKQKQINKQIRCFYKSFFDINN